MRRALLCLLVAFCAPAWAHLARPQQDVEFEQRLGASIPLEARFVDERGEDKPLGARLSDAPIVLQLGYLRCRDLCGVTLAATAAALAGTGLEPGRDYQALFASIDPRDSPRLAKAKKIEGVPAQERTAWRFLTGPKPSIEALTGAMGFHYKRDDQTGEYAHPSGIVILTPRGTVSRYFGGVRYEPGELREALQDAARGVTGRLADRIFLLCYHYDPATGRYSVAIITMLRVITLVLFATAALLLWRRARRTGP